MKSMHCHCWDDCLGPCCWCGDDDDDTNVGDDLDIEFPPCIDHPDDDCARTIAARNEMRSNG